MLRMKKAITVLSSIILMVCASVQSQTIKENSNRMEWFKDAKLGIFIHYGIYAVNGIDESWSFFNGYLSHKDYMKQLNGFTASEYKPNEWAKLFKEAGAKYAVLTSKHHDGVALWKGNFDHFNVVDHTPAGRDLIQPFAEAMRENGLKVGLYYSLIDWSHPDYPAFTRETSRYQNDAVRWQRFVDFYFGQMSELSERYNPDLYWFDGDWEHSAEAWRAKKLREKLLSYNKNVIINSRLKGYGDYDTPEQGVPVKKPANPYWELCLTMNDSWGYQHNDQNYKSPYQLLLTFVDCISKGGNLLLDMGPKEDGSIPEPQVKILKEFARWTGKHSEAIYGTRAGLPEGHFLGPTALSKDNKTIFLYLDHKFNTPITLQGLKSEVNNVRIVGSNYKPAYKADSKTGLLTINVPASEYDQAITVVAVELKQPVQLTTTEVSLAEAALKPLKTDDEWTRKHAAFLENYTPGIASFHYGGPSFLSKDKSILYLVVNGKPNGPLAIKGLKNQINRIWVVGNGTKLSHQVIGKLYWSHVPGIAYVDVPETVLDSKATVIAVLLDGPVSLYTEEGQVIESN